MAGDRDESTRQAAGSAVRGGQSAGTVSWRSRRGALCPPECPDTVRAVIGDFLAEVDLERAGSHGAVSLQLKAKKSHQAAEVARTELAEGQCRPVAAQCPRACAGAQRPFRLGGNRTPRGARRKRLHHPGRRRSIQHVAAHVLYLLRRQRQPAVGCVRDDPAQDRDADDAGAVRGHRRSGAAAQGAVGGIVRDDRDAGPAGARVERPAPAARRVPPQRPRVRAWSPCTPSSSNCSSGVAKAGLLREDVALATQAALLQELLLAATCTPRCCPAAVRPVSTISGRSVRRPYCVART